MVSREAKLALMAVGVGLLAHQAYKNTEALRDRAVEFAKYYLDYDRLEQSGNLEDVNIRVPGKKVIAEAISDIIARPGSSWKVLSGGVPEEFARVEERFSNLEGLFLQMRYVPTNRFSKYGSRLARIEYYIVGENNLLTPPRFLPGFDKES